MISNTWKLAAVLGIAGAIALSVASAEARNVRNPVRGAVASDHYVPRGSYNMKPVRGVGAFTSAREMGPPITILMQTNHVSW